MKVVIIEYNAGNIRSVDFALQRLGVSAEITNDVNKIHAADKVIFPGVGEASSAMHYLRERGLDKVIKELTQPVLGICIGLQLLCSHSDEGNIDCIGVFEEKVTMFDNKKQRHLKVPQMGWNTITKLQTNLFTMDLEGRYVYFVHSYRAELGPNTIATTNYITDYSAALHKNNFYATQFHPEKSGSVGEQILKNFLAL